MATANNRLQGDTETFETGVGNWITPHAGYTIASTGAQFHDGAASMAATTTTAAAITLGLTRIPAAPGENLTISFWVRTAETGWQVRFDLDWYTAGGGGGGGTYLGTSSSSLQTLTANTWTMHTATVTAPASTATCELFIYTPSPTAAGQVLYVDQVFVGIAYTPGRMVLGQATGGSYLGVGDTLGGAAYAEAAVGAGSASDAGAAATVNAEQPAAAGSAGDAMAAVAVNSEQPTAAGQAFDATVSASSSTNASAGGVAVTVLMRGRALAERLMVDACDVQHRTGESNPGGGVVTAQWGAAYYSGPCRVQVEQVSGQAVDVGEAQRIVARRKLQLPMVTETQALIEGDRVTVTASAHDPALEGRVYLVRDVEAKTHATCRRAVLIEVTS